MKRTADTATMHTVNWPTDWKIRYSARCVYTFGPQFIWHFFGFRWCCYRHRRHGAVFVVVVVPNFFFYANEMKFSNAFIFVGENWFLPNATSMHHWITNTFYFISYHSGLFMNHFQPSSLRRDFQILFSFYFLCFVNQNHSVFAYHFVHYYGCCC